MTAYYNEIDPFAVAWTRELIARKIIADGVVDDRSIAIVQPEDLRGFTQCHFFAGIGVWSYALRLAGWPDDRSVWTGSCPCQPYSGAGKGEGANDPRHLWPEWFRLIRQCRPDDVFGEQVERAIRHGWLDLVSADVESEGYAIGSVVFGSHSVGAPHIRQRCYFVAQSNGDGRDQERRGQSAPGDDGTVGDGWVGAMANAAGRRRDSRSVGRISQTTDCEGQRQLGIDDGRLVVDASSGGRRVIGDASLARSRGHTDGAGVTGVLGFAGFAGLEGHAGNVNSRDESGRFDSDAARPAPEAGPVSGLWSDAEWIPCTDGKARPVEPGTFPLAHGAPARVGRLRGYGNAINAEQARAFIEVYLDVRGG